MEMVVLSVIRAKVEGLDTLCYMLRCLDASLLLRLLI
jgi:hypothetical protein